MAEATERAVVVAAPRKTKAEWIHEVMEWLTLFLGLMEMVKALLERKAEGE